MKICAITMVYKDYWALSKWYAHYARHLGAGALYVVSHGNDPKIAEICPGASVITVPRDELDGFDRKRGQMLNGLQDSLAVAYDWVIRTDADELICFDPNYFGSFAEVLETLPGTSVFALGVEVDGDPFDDTSHGIFTGHYSKAWAVQGGTHMMRHGVVSDDASVFDMPRGVYLLHLKYASPEALRDANAVRQQVADLTGSGRPGAAWSDAERDAVKTLAYFEGLPVVDWKIAENVAFERVSSAPVLKDGVVRARSGRFACRSVLPQWFKYC